MKHLLSLKPCLKLTSCLMLMVAVLPIAGCRIAGYQKGDRAALRSETAAAEIQTEARELDASMVALSDLVNQPATDAKPQFLRFSEALDRLAASSRRATNSLDRLWVRRGAYFQVWDQEIAAIKDDDVRRRSQTRRAEVAEQFDAASRQHEEAQKLLEPLIDYLRDIRRALSTDLTRQGLAAVQPLVTNASQTAGRVQGALTKSANDPDTLSARTASFRVQEAK